jgi:two-component system OmpR family sensor kinase
MRIRLFGKILLAFWLTLFVMSQGLWVLYAGAAGAGPKAGAEIRSGAPVLMLLARRLESSGPAAAQSDLSLLPARFRNQITIAQNSGQPLPSSDARPGIAREAVAPDGRRYLLVYRPPGSGGSLDIPPKVLIVAAAAGLVFSLVLAAYLTRPLMTLRRGFRRMAQGDLDVQLADRIGRRGDEISDLARDFDVMAVRLRQLITARDRLLNDVSHELRSPLTRLQLAIGLARQDPKRTEDSLERIDREAGRLDAIVHELLALARAESGAAEEFNEYFDPMAVVESVVSDAGFEAQMSGRQIRLETPRLDEQSHPSIRGSAELVRRAIENVVRNALRFSPAGGRVEVAAEIVRQPLRYRFTVVDEGRGVDAESLGNLFDPFVRGDREGVGLGLAIARRAILAHDGQIRARNREGGGFMVEIEIPAVAHDASPDAVQTPCA